MSCLAPLPGLTRRRLPWLSALAWAAAASLVAIVETAATLVDVKIGIIVAVGFLAIACIASRPVLLLPLAIVAVNAEHLTFSGLGITRAIAPLVLLVTVTELLRGTGRLRLSAPLWWAGGYAVWALASGIWTVSMEGTGFLLQSLGIAGVFMLAFAVLPNTEADLRQVLHAYVGIAALMAVISVFAFAWNLEIPHLELLQGGRAQGGVGDPDFFAAMQLVAIPLALVLASETMRPELRLALYGGVLALIASVFTSLSRGAFLAVAVLAVLFLVSRPEKVFRSRHEKAIALLVVALGMAFFFSRPFVRDEVVGRAESIYAPTTREDETGSGRTNIWKAALRTFADNPGTGIGFGSFIYVSEDLILHTPGVDLTVYGDRDAGDNYVAHNTYLGTLAELGLVGLVLYVGLLISTGRALRRTAGRAFALGVPFVGRVSHALLLGLASWAVSTFFLSGETARMLWIVVGLSLALPKLLPGEGTGVPGGSRPAGKPFVDSQRERKPRVSMPSTAEERAAAMESPYERLVELSKRLRVATDKSQLDWTAEDDTTFLWTGSSGAVSVRSRDGDGEEPFELDVFGAAKQKVETLGSEWTEDEQPAAWNDALARLYRAARRRALGVDRILDDLLAELPRARDEASSSSKR